MITDIFPDPDLPPLIIDKDRISKIKNDLPELPDQKKKLDLLKFIKLKITTQKSL